MRVWTCDDHDYHYPVGVASVVVAETEKEARQLLLVALRAQGLAQREITAHFTLTELPLNVAQAIILCNGEY